MIDYVNSSDYYYAQRQLAIRAEAKKKRLRGERDAARLVAKKAHPTVDLDCSICGTSYSIQERGNRIRIKNGHPPMCRTCIGRGGAKKRFENP